MEDTNPKISIVYLIIVLFIVASAIPNVSGDIENNTRLTLKEYSSNYILNGDGLLAYWSLDEGDGNTASPFLPALAVRPTR